MRPERWLSGEARVLKGNHEAVEKEEEQENGGKEGGKEQKGGADLG